MIKTSYNKKMRKQTLYITSILILAMLLLSACGGTAEAETTPTVDNASIIATSIAQTMQAMTETQAAQVTPTLASTSTPMALPSITVPAAGLPTSTVQTVSLPTNCLIAGLVSETIPDGTIVAKGSTFTKTWSIRNGGTCTWSTGYKMVFESGDLLGATSESVNLTQNVGPGMMTAVSMKLTAPNIDGTYIGYWMLQTDAGVNVGRFSVNVYVGTPTATPFAITSVSYPNQQIELGVSQSSTVVISVTADASGTAIYSIESSDPLLSNIADKTGELVFTAAGTKTISYTITCPAATGLYNLDIEVYISSPNNQNFPLHYVDLKCQ